MASLYPHPNPDTPSAFLPPAGANQLEASRYIMIATCGMFTWDILINLRNDFHLLTKYRIGFPTVIYFLSRVASLAFIVSTTVFHVGAVGDCQNLQAIGVGTCFVATVSLTTLLFFFRVRAIFHDNKRIVVFFLLVWLGTVAASAVVPFTITASHIGPTDLCVSTGINALSSLGIIVLAVNDTLIFFAISWRLLSSSVIDKSFKAKMKIFISGHGLPALSRSLLQSGQEYYFITVTANILTMAMILAPASIPVYVRSMLTVPNAALGNSMACYVYRDIKFGRISSSSCTINPVPSTDTLNFQVPHPT